MATKSAERCPYCKETIGESLARHLEMCLDAPTKRKLPKKILARIVEDRAAAIRSMEGL